LQGRLLLRPSPELNDIAAGVLGRAQRLYPVDLVALSLLSNHYHMIVRAESAKRLSRFVGYFNSNLAREVSRLTGWTGKIWDRRYQAILISNEEEVQVARFRYVLSHGVKENLVARLREWPGLQSVRQLADGEPLAGTWFDRTQEYLARRKGETVDRLRYATPETVTFSPLPCWKDLSPEAYRQRVANMAAEIEEDAAAARTRTGAEPLGVAAILAQDPTSRPKRLKKSPAPLFPCGEPSHAPLLLRGILLVCGRLPHGGREAPEGRPRPAFSHRELPAGVAVRRRGERGCRADPDRLSGDLDLHRLKGRRGCIQEADLA
jgi:REP element-mobilizing transposase RayT